MRTPGPAALLALTLLAGCARPLSEDKKDWVGQWKDGEARLVITAGGRLEWERRSGGASSSVSAPIQAIDDGHIVAGVGFLRTTFAVGQPPRRRPDGLWTVVVDGHELVKADPLGRDPRATVVPPLDQLRALVGDDLHRLSRGIQAADFTEFRDHASTVLQSQLTGEKLKEGYQTFVDRKLALEPYMAGEAVLVTEPTITEEGVLKVHGRYPPAQGVVLTFDSSYVHGQAGWRSAGLSVSLRKPE